MSDEKDVLLLESHYFERQLNMLLQLNTNPFTTNHTILWDLIGVYMGQNICYCKKIIGGTKDDH